MATLCAVTIKTPRVSLTPGSGAEGAAFVGTIAAVAVSAGTLELAALVGGGRAGAVATHAKSKASVAAVMLIWKMAFFIYSPTHPGLVCRFGQSLGDGGQHVLRGRRQHVWFPNFEELRLGVHAPLQ